jgi:hypothetical protein
MKIKLRFIIFLQLLIISTILILYGLLKYNQSGNNHNDIILINNYFVDMSESVTVHNRTSNQRIAKKLFNSKTSSPKTKNSIFCIILTTKNNLDTRAKAVYDTWAKLCDDVKFVAGYPFYYRYMYEYSDDQAEIFYKNFSVLKPPGLKSDVYSQLPDKMLLTYKYIFKKYNNYDWYLKTDDDTYIFMNNLRKFLSSKNSSKPVTYGYDYKIKVPNGYQSGGGGYVLSNEAMNRLGKKLNEDYSFCEQTDSEDVDVASCLRKMDVLPEKSLDELGRERFHALNLMLHYKGIIPDWFFNYSANIIKTVIFCFNYMKVF